MADGAESVISFPAHFSPGVHVRFTSPAVVFIASALASASIAYGQQNQPSPPVADRQPHTTSIHGYTLTDDYFWLRQKTNPAVRSYLETENAYTATVMKPTEALQ